MSTPALLLSLIILWISLISLYLQLSLYRKFKKQPGQSARDEEYIQKFFSSVGAYLEDDSKSPPGGYKSMAADIYRHIPNEHWVVVEKIDQAIRSNNVDEAWNYLKFLSQSLARDGIRPYVESEYFIEKKINMKEDE